MTKQAPWEVYLLLAETELKFGCQLEAISLLTEAKSKIKQISSEQEYLLKKCEAEAAAATICTDKLERAVQLCDEVRYTAKPMYIRSKKKSDVDRNLIYLEKGQVIAFQGTRKKIRSDIQGFHCTENA